MVIEVGVFRKTRLHGEVIQLV